LIRQWYGYGRYHPYLFAKHNESALELYVRLGRPVAGERYSCLLYKRLPIAIIIFFTKFLMLHLFFCGMIVAWLLGWAAAGWVSLSFTAALAFLYAWPDLRDAGLYSGWSFAAVRYVADMALFIGAFIGGLRQKMLYFSATVD
jgi:hypothetical protein